MSGKKNLSQPGNGSKPPIGRVTDQLRNAGYSSFYFASPDSLTGGKYVSSVDNLDDRIISKMRKNGMVKFGLSFLKYPIIGSKVSFKCTDPEIQSFIKSVFDPIWMNLIKTSLLSLDYGRSPHEIIWKNVVDYSFDVDDMKISKNAFIIDSVKELYPSDYKPEYDEFGYIQLSRINDSTSNILLSGPKAFHNTFDGYWDNLNGESILIPVYEWWYHSIILVQSMLRYFERQGLPWMKGFANATPQKDSAGNDINMMAECQKAMLSISDGCAVTLPAMPSDDKGYVPMMDIFMMEDSKQASDKFLAALNHFETMILRSMLIPERVLTQDITGSGSYSLAQTHEEMYFNLLQAIQTDLYQTIENTLIKWLVDFNYGVNAPKVTIEAEGMTAEQKAVLSDVLKSLVQNKSIKVDLKYLSNLFGIPLEENEDKQPDPVNMLVADKSDGELDNPADKNNIPVKGKIEPDKTLSKNDFIWHRDLTWVEDKALGKQGIINLSNSWDSAEQNLQTELLKILDDDIIPAIKKDLEKGLDTSNPTKEIQNLKIKYSGKWESVIKGFLTDCYQLGFTGAQNELGVKLTSIPNESRSNIIGISDTLTQDAFNIMTKKAQLSAQMSYQKSMSNLQIINKAITAISDWATGYIKNQALTQSGIFVNLGRSDVEYFVEKNGGDDPIVAGQYSAIIDSSTCPLCKYLDRQIISVNNPDWGEMQPDFHEGCRCIMFYLRKSMLAVNRKPNYIRPTDDLLDHKSF